MGMMQSLPRFLKLLLLWLFLGPLHGTFAYPYHHHHSEDHEGVGLSNQTHPFAEFGYSPVNSRADKPELRILPLGASIVFGVGSSTGNGGVISGKTETKEYESLMRGTQLSEASP